MWYAIFSDIHVLDNLCYQTHRSDIIDLSLSNIVGSLCVLKIKGSLIFIIATVWTTQLRVLSSHNRYKLFQHIYGHSLLFKGGFDINIECLTSHQEWSPTIVQAVLLFLFLCHNMYILYFSSYFQTSYTCTIRKHMFFHTWVILILWLSSVTVLLSIIHDYQLEQWTSTLIYFTALVSGIFVSFTPLPGPRE